MSFPKNQIQNQNLKLNLNSINTQNKLDIKSIISSTIVNKEYAIHLTPIEIQYINDIIYNDPELLSIIGNSVDSILSDGVVNLYDIPTIILLLSEIFKSHCIKKIIYNIDIIHIVRFILESIIDYQYLPLPIVDKNIIKNIIETTFNLLESSVDLKKEINSSCVSITKYFCCF